MLEQFSKLFLQKSIQLIVFISIIACHRKNAELLSVEKLSCASFNTRNRSDGENVVVRRGPNYKFNLYWSGRASKFSVWENNRANDYYEVRFNPFAFYLLDDRGQVTSSIACEESGSNAYWCTERFEALLIMINGARRTARIRQTKISIGKEMTFKCAEDFANKKIEELKRHLPVDEKF